MNFDVPARVEQLRQKVRQFAEQDIQPVARELDEKEEFSSELTRRMGEEGLFGINLPRVYGGAGLGYLEYIVAVEEIARIDGSQAATLAAHNSLGIGPIYYYGNEGQKSKYLPELCTGKRLWAFGLTEATAGSDAGGTKTRAEKVEDGWLINGSKMFITNGSSPISLGTTIQAVTGTRPDGKKEYSCFLVENTTEGFEANTLTGKMMWRASNTAKLRLKDVRVSDEALLGKQGDGFAQMLESLDHGRLSIAAMGLGAAQGAYDLAVKRAKSRKQFGKPISTFQAIGFKLADMLVEIEAARNLIYKAAWLCDQGRDFRLQAAMAKLYCSEVARRCVDSAVQIYGGYGLMKENRVERLFRDQRILEIGEGTSEIQRLIISRHIGCYEVASDGD